MSGSDPRPVPHDAGSLRRIKIVVAVMGALIFFGSVGLVVAAVTYPRQPSGDTAVRLPPGASIAETRTGDGLIVLRLTLPNGDSRLIVIDAGTGMRLRAIDLEAAAPAARDASPGGR